MVDSRLPFSRWWEEEPVVDSRLPFSRWEEEEPLWDGRLPFSRWEEEEPLWDSRLRPCPRGGRRRANRRCPQPQLHQQHRLLLESGVLPPMRAALHWPGS